MSLRKQRGADQVRAMTLLFEFEMSSTIKHSEQWTGRQRVSLSILATWEFGPEQAEYVNYDGINN